MVFAGQAVDLHGAHDAAPVRRVEPGRALRIEGAQALKHGLAADRVVLRSDGGAQVFVPLRPLGEVPPREQGVDVQPGPAHEHGRFARGEQPVADRPGLLHIAGDGVVLPGLADVEHVVRDKGALFGRGLGGADVHAAVDLHGVGRDDLAAVTLRQGDAEAGLARGRRPADNKDFRFHSFHGFFSFCLCRQRIGCFCPAAALTCGMRPPFFLFDAPKRKNAPRPG